MQYLIVIEQTATGFSAYLPDLPGCVSTSTTREEIEANMREAVEFHLEGLKLEGLEISQPTSSSAYIEVASPLFFDAAGAEPPKLGDFR